MATIEASAAGGKYSEPGAWVGAKVPGAGDDVILAAGSGSITVGALAECRSLEASAYKKTLKIENPQVLKVGTSTSNGGLGVNIGAGVKFEGSGAIEFVSTSGTVETVALSKSVGSLAFVFNGAGGKWRLEEALTYLRGLELLAGELDTNGKEISSKGGFLAKGTSTLTLGASVIKLQSTATNEIASPVTLNAGTSVIEILDTTTVAKTFTGGGHSYATLTVSGTNLVITGSNTFVTLNVNTARATTSCKGTLTAVSNYIVITEGEANIAVGVEVTGTAIPVGTTILKKIEAGVWEMSAKATETIAVPETVTVFSAGLLFAKGTTQTVTGSFTTNGNAGEEARLATNEAGKSATLKNGTGAAISVDYMRLKDSHTSGTAAYAGTHSTNVSGNEGWKFEVPPGVIPLNAAASVSAASCAVSAATLVAFTAAASTSSGTAVLAAPTQVALGEAASSSSATLNLSAPTTVRLASAASSSSAAVSLSAPTVIPIAAASGTSTGTLGLSASTQIPLNAAHGETEAGLALSASTQIPINVAAGASSASLSLSAPTRIVFGVAQGASSATLSLTTPSQVPLASAASMSTASAALSTATRVSLASAESISSASLMLSALSAGRKPTRITIKNNRQARITIKNNRQARITIER